MPLFRLHRGSQAKVGRTFVKKTYTLIFSKQGNTSDVATHPSVSPISSMAIDEHVAAQAAAITENKRILRSDTRDAQARAASVEDASGISARSRTPPSIPFVTKPKMLSRLSAAKRTASFSASSKPSTFKPFFKLPPELRIKIWKYAVSGPRVIRIRVKMVVSELSHHVLGMNFDSSAAVPAILHACRESRHVGLLHYELGMRSHLSEARIYVDFIRDTIYFGQENMNKGFALSQVIRDIPQAELAKIRRLGMGQELWNERPICNGHVLMDFSNLKCITLAMERDTAAAHRNVAFQKPKEDDHTIVGISDPDYPVDEEDGFHWPCEMEEIIYDQLIDSFGDMDRELPQLKFKMLTGIDKPVRKAKGKLPKN